MTGKLKASWAEPLSPLAQRDELIRKRDEAYRSYTEHTAARQEAERAMGQLQRRLHAGELDGDSEGDLEDAFETAQADYDRSLAKANVALDKTKGLESEIEALYSRSFSDFAEEANRVSSMAGVALTDFLEAWRRARSTWQAATEAWAPLCRSVCISGVGPFPVTEHVLSEVLNGEATATPAGVEIFEDGDVLTD
jgi:hypothetical protein